MMETYIGKPCKRGHGGERYISGGCIYCARERSFAIYHDDPEKARATAREEYANNPRYREQRKVSSRKTYLKLGASESYRARRRKYNGLPNPTRPEPAACECCATDRADKHLCVDHCHVSGVFRGWICHNCNHGMGKFGDSIKGLMNAVRYLERAGSDNVQ